MGIGYFIGCINCIKDEDVVLIGTEDDNKINGTFFDICLGKTNVFCCKEELKDYYTNNISEDFIGTCQNIGTPTDDKTIDKIIKANIQNGFEFTENLGYSAYYCVNCKKLFNYLYLQLKKDNQIYTPEYLCKKCNVYLKQVKVNIDNDKYYLKNIDINEENYVYDLYLENNIVKIKNSNNLEMELICDNCKKNKFIILGGYIAD